MPTLEEFVDRNLVPSSHRTTVRDLLELARGQPSRIYTWVVVRLPEDIYAVTRMNEIADKAQELGDAILDMGLGDIPDLLQPGGSVQITASLEEAEEQAQASPGERIVILENEQVVGVLNLGAPEPPLPNLDPWSLEGMRYYRWPPFWDLVDLQLSRNLRVLDPWTPVNELVSLLDSSAEGWLYVVVRKGASFYSVMAIDTSLVRALDEGPASLRTGPIDALPLPEPMPSAEEGKVPWEVVRQGVLQAPGRCLPLTRDGEVIGVLAEPARRVPTAGDWRQALSGQPPWGEASEMAAMDQETEPPPQKSIAVREDDGELQEELGAEEPPPRFFNAGFFPEKEDTLLPAEQPLALDGGTYRLGVNVGKFWGPGEKPEDRFALDPIVREALEKLEEGKALSLVVAVRPRAVGSNLAQVELPRKSGFGFLRRLWGRLRKPVSPDGCRQELKLPKYGDGPYAFFDLTFTHPGLHALNVDLFYQGHLLQSLRVEMWVVEHAGDAVPAGSKPQDRRLTFSRTGTLSEDRLAALEKRPSTLTILMDEQDGELGLWFYDVDGHTLGTQQPNLSDAILRTLLERMRAALQEVENSYPGQIGGSREKLRLSLWRLASVGNEFYRALLPRVFDPGAPGPAGQLAELNLTPGQVIQVAPLSKLPGVPWELLYDREIERFREEQPDRVKLCPDFEIHPPEACPHQGSRVVCPHSFWGYRYIIEQLPNRIEPDEQDSLADLPLLVRNGRPLKFLPLVYGWENLDSHLQALRALAQAEDLNLEPEITTLDALEFALKDQVMPADIFYFYAHGGFDAHEPMLELGLEGQEFSFTAGDLAAWKNEIDLSLRQPLVVINACQTAAFLPEHYESLPKGFADRGASGVIGTQVKVHELFASHFIQLFFQRFLAQKSVGQSLFEARRELLFNYVQGEGGREYRPDPRGLVYSLFAAADVMLAQPVIGLDRSVQGGKP